MKCPITFGKIDKSLIGVVLTILSNFLNNLALRLLDMYTGDYNPLLLMSIMTVSEATVIFAHLILQKQFTQKKYHQVAGITVHERQLEYELEELESTPAQRITNLSLMIWVIPIAFFDTIGSSVTQVLTDWGFRDEKRYSKVVGLLDDIFQFIAVVIFSNVLLKFKTYYVHHLLGFSLIFLGLILCIVLEGARHYWNLSVLVSAIVNSFLAAGEFILQRYLLFSKYVSPYKLIAIQGVEGAFVILLTCLILHLIPCSKLEKFGFCEDTTGKFTFKELVYNFDSDNIKRWKLGVGLAIYGLSTLFFNIGLALINLNLGPHYIPTTKIFLLLPLALLDLRKKEEHLKAYAGLSVSAIGTLIFSEIIILSFCGLDKNCKVVVEKRALLENQALIEDTDD